MPVVPYDPVPKVSEQAPGIPGPRFETPGAAFGLNIGEAGQRLADTMGRGGEELFSRAMNLQRLNNETLARRTAITATQQMAIAQSKFDVDPNRGDPQVQMAHYANLNSIREQFRAGLNREAANMYDAEAANLQNRFTAASAARGAEAFRQTANGTARASIDMRRRTINPWDENEFEAKLTGPGADHDWETIRHSSDPPMSDEMLADAKLKERQKARAEQLQLQAQLDAPRAYANWNKYQDAGELDPAQAPALRAMIWDHNRDTASTQIANTVYNKDKPMEKAVEEARKLAKDQGLDDPKFVGHVEQVVAGRYVYQKGIQTDQIRRYENDVMRAIGTGAFISKDDLMKAHPEIQPALDYLRDNDPKFYNGLQAAVTNHWKSEMQATNQNNFDRLVAHRWGGDLNTFMEESANVMSIPMDQGQRNKIIALREQVMRDPYGDPAVTDAIRQLQVARRGDLIALGIFSRPDKDTDNPEWNTYIAALHGGIEAYRMKFNKSPGPQEIKDIIGPYAIGQVGVPGRVWNTWTKPIEQEVLDKAKEEIRRDSDIPNLDISDMEARTQAYRNMFMDEFSKPKSKPK